MNNQFEEKNEKKLNLKFDISEIINDLSKTRKIFFFRGRLSISHWVRN